ncbi:MAG: hypothetical protein ACO2ZZ_08605 [Cyclobacteriaceae bacterium]
MRRSSLLLVLALFLSLEVFSQEETPKNYQLSGYLKDMASFNFQEGLDSALIDNLVHNRLNFRWFPNDKFQLRIEIRNRIFTGDLVSLFPNYGELVDVNNDYFDASWTVVNHNDLVIHSMIDRAYFEWKEDTWSLQVGRQRINWGINLAWNPNDIFNAYSFFDFDYEERPGTDAIRFQKYRGYAGGYEIAVKMADSIQALTAGFLYKWNYNDYDFQVLTGVMQNNLAIGGGWAGSIGTLGFKGEATWFEPLDDSQERTVMTAISSDYIFPNSLFLTGSLLYISNPLGDGSFALTSTANLDIRSILPFKWTTFLQASYPLHPLFNVGLSGMVFPGNQGVFINPYFTWSIVNNLDLDVLGQLFVNGQPASAYVGYTRIKWSF